MPRPAFALDLLVPGPPEQVWARLWDLDRHTAAIPFTTVTTVTSATTARTPTTATTSTTTPDPGGPADSSRAGLAQGVRFTARTALGPFGLDDDMVVRAWDPPQHAVIEKVGAVLGGTIEIDLRPAGSSTRLRWTQTIEARLGRARVPHALAGLAARPVRAAYRRALVRITRP